ncbi:MAG: hypothetical protein IPJ13_24395 [Saprospiraceae bacterium]|nr:hypothetical protein [Saprospiraceae bacterium]
MPFAFQVDQLSIIMVLLITGVGSLIHIYSIEYMHGDKGFNRFFHISISSFSLCCCL